MDDNEAINRSATWLSLAETALYTALIRAIRDDDYQGAVNWLGMMQTLQIV